MLVQQSGLAPERKAHNQLLQESRCKEQYLQRHRREHHPEQHLIQRVLISHEQKWEDLKTVKTPRDVIIVGTEHPRSEEWKGKGRVAGARLKPDLVWLRRDTGGQWRKVVVDVKVTSTDKLNEAFQEKDEKFRDWTMKETREKKLAKVVMVPLIISLDGAVHSDTVRRWAMEGLRARHQG